MIIVIACYNFKSIFSRYPGESRKGSPLYSSFSELKGFITKEKISITLGYVRPIGSLKCIMTSSRTSCDVTPVCVGDGLSLLRRHPIQLSFQAPARCHSRYKLRYPYRTQPIHSGTTLRVSRLIKNANQVKAVTSRNSLSHTSGACSDPEQ